MGHLNKRKGVWRFARSHGTNKHANGALGGVSYLYDEGWEGGDYTGWTAFDNDAKISVHADAANNGSYGVRCELDSGNHKFITPTGFTMPASGIIRMRTYIYIPTGTDTAVDGMVFGINFIGATGGWQGNPIVSMWLVWNAGNGSFDLQFYGMDDAKSWPGGTKKEISFDTWHYIEVEVVRATGAAANDGTTKAWLDGSAYAALTGVDNFNIWAADARQIVIGLSSSSAGSAAKYIYWDDFKALDSSTEIGAE
jgi:hypothetical protein